MKLSTFPADEHAEKTITQHEDQHGKDKEIEVDEEALEAFLVFHIADRVDVDQRPHTGHDQR